MEVEEAGEVICGWYIPPVVVICTLLCRNTFDSNYRNICTSATLTWMDRSAEANVPLVVTAYITVPLQLPLGGVMEGGITHP